MTLQLGRLTLDDQGIHQSALLGLFGRRFSLAWAELEAWSTHEERMVSPQHPEGQVLARLLRFEARGRVEQVRWGRGAAAFDAFVAELMRRLPERRRQAESVGYHVRDLR